MEETDYMFDAAIPGESLTGELGAKPYERPPQFPTVEQNISLYMQSIFQENTMPVIAEHLENGRRVSDLAEILITSGVANGRHTIDVGVLILPIIMEMLALVGDMFEVKYDMGIDDEEDIKDNIVEFVTKGMIKENDDRYNQDVEFLEDMDMDMDVAEDVPEEEMSMPMAEPAIGLMARR